MSIERMPQDFVWVVYNINGDIIGIADNINIAFDIYEERYGNIPKYTDERIRKFELNKMQYA